MVKLPSLKEMLLRRLRNHGMCCACRCLYVCVEVQSALCLIPSSCNMLISGTDSSNEKVTPN